MSNNFNLGDQVVFVNDYGVAFGPIEITEVAKNGDGYEYDAKDFDNRLMMKEKSLFKYQGEEDIQLAFGREMSYQEKVDALDIWV